jgi:hypothetical protein
MISTFPGPDIISLSKGVDRFGQNNSVSVFVFSVWFFGVRVFRFGIWDGGFWNE